MMNLRFKHYRFQSKKNGGINRNSIRKKPGENQHRGKYGTASLYGSNKCDWTPSNNGGYTVCELVKENEVILTGIASCNPKEGFCKRIGRKVSLRHLLEKIYARKDSAQCLTLLKQS